MRLFLALLLGCGTPSSDASRTDGSAPPEERPEQLPDDSGNADTGGTDTGPEEETWPKRCDELYDPDTLVEFDLQFDETEWSAIQSDCWNGIQQYRPVQLTYGGETVPAKVRLKGNWSWSCSKMQFVVSFNEDDPDARFHGLRKLVFDAPWYDHTLLHERVAFSLFEARGLPTSCVNNAKVSVNGSYYGLYANTERIDHEYLERNFEDPSGNLYQGGAELKTNEDVADTSRIYAYQSATTIEEVAALVDLDEAVAEWAVEAMLPALDNYWAGVEINYYLYDHPARGFVYLPYDMDITFGDAAYTDGTLLAPGAATVDPILYEHSGWLKEPVAKIVLADPTWCARFVEELRLVREVWDPDALAAQVADWDAQIADAFASDPHALVTPRRHADAVALLRAFFAERAAYVDSWLASGDHCPGRW